MLDAKIKEIANNRLTSIVNDASKALDDLELGPLSVQDVARLISDHKTKATRAKCAKLLIEDITKEMVDNLPV